MSVVVVGANHRTAPLEMLERMALQRDDLPKVLHALAGSDHILEVAVLATCNRTEVYLVADRFHPAYKDVRDFFADLTFLPPEEFAEHLFVLYDDEAVRHLFEVAAGLDSAVLGEHEIIGQVRGAWEGGQNEGTVGPTLNLLFRHAIETGKRARTDTSIGRHITSVSQAAVAVAADRLGGLEGRSAVVLGAGSMGRGIAGALSGAGVESMVIANRSRARAVELADRFDGRAVLLEQLGDELAGADLVVSGTGAPGWVLQADEVSRVMARRPDRALLIVDVAVPRDVDPAAGSVPGVTVLDMDAISAFTDRSLAERAREATAVEHIVTAELERYRAAGSAREVAPLVAEFRAHAEAVRTAEMERFAARLAELDPEQVAAVEALTRGIVAKLVHEPTVRLKDAAGSSTGDRLADALRRLFDL